MAQNILVLPGDGIGQEVMTEVRRVVDWFGDNRGLEVNITEDKVGGAAYDAYGAPITDAITSQKTGLRQQGEHPGEVLNLLPLTLCDMLHFTFLIRRKLLRTKRFHLKTASKLLHLIETCDWSFR